MCDTTFHRGQRVRVGKRHGTIRDIDVHYVDVRMDDDPDGPYSWFAVTEVHAVKPSPAPFTDKQAVAAMKRLAARWPDHLMIFSAAGTLCVVDMRVNADVEPALRHSSVLWSCNEQTINNDGGDPDWVD